MPINGFSVGRDITLDIITAQGLLQLGLLTQFTSKPEVTDEKIKGLDGITRHVRFPDGWSGSFELKRQDNRLDTYFTQLEEDYYAGLNEQPATITETIVEPNGTLSQYRYEGVLLKLEEAGDWQGDKTIQQKLSFVASRRRRLI